MKGGVIGRKGERKAGEEEKEKIEINTRLLLGILSEYRNDGYRASVINSRETPSCHFVASLVIIRSRKELIN